MDDDKSQYWLDLAKEHDEQTVPTQEEDAPVSNGAVTTSFIFKMGNVESFVRNKLGPYILEITQDSKFEVTKFRIDTSLLACDVMRNVAHPSFRDLAMEQPEVYAEKLEIVVFENNYAVIVDTLYKIIASNVDSYDEESGTYSSSTNSPLESIETVDSYADSLSKALFTQSRPYLNVDRRRRDEYSGVSEDSDEYMDIIGSTGMYDAKYWKADLRANSCAAKLIDFIINSSLDSDGEYSKVSFFFPNGVDYSEVEFKSGEWTPFNTFGESFEAGASINFILYSNDRSHEIEARKRIVYRIEEVITNKQHYIIDEHLQESFEDTVYTYSVRNGLAVVSFKRWCAFSQVKYEGFLYKYISRVINKIECVIEWKKCLFQLENDPNEKYKSQLFKRTTHKVGNFLKSLSAGYRRKNGVHPEELMLKLEFMENDILQTEVSDSEELAAKVWLKKTNTLELIKHLESLCEYFIKVKGNGDGDRNGKLLNLIGVLTIASAVFDFWAIMDKNPGGSYVLSGVVAAIIILLTVIFWPRR